MKKEIFDEVKNEVISICDNLGYKYVFRFSCFSFRIFGRKDRCGEIIITGNLLNAVSSVPNVVLNNIGVDDNGLYALFLVCS